MMRWVLGIALFAGLLAAPLLARSAQVHAASDLQISLATNTTKAKIGDAIAFTVRLENTGADTVPGLRVTLGLPDALDARAVYCPFSTGDTVVDCLIGDLAPGTIAEVQFFVQAGSRTANGPVSVQAVDSTSAVLASTELSLIKIIGSPHR
jgi:uncharacterized repeat protein (TIGR01451 family)